VVVRGLPRSCFKVLEVLASSNNGISQKELINYLGLSNRTIKYALKKLKQQKLIYDSIVFQDIRKKLYFYGGKQRC